MNRAFWTWAPVWIGGCRHFDEPHAYRQNKWFFDKSVWQKMFRTMSGCGFNAMLLADTHPFPFMIDLHAYPEARTVDDLTSAQYQQMHQWIIKTARDYDIAPYVFFFNIYLPEPMLKAHGIHSGQDNAPLDLAIEYTHHCCRQLLESYPDLAGIYTDVPLLCTSAGGSDVENGNECHAREIITFLQQAVVDAVDAARPDAALYLSCSEQLEPVSIDWNLSGFVRHISRRGRRPIRYSISYTRNYLVDPNPDASFRSWLEAVGASNVCAEFRLSNFEPWTCFSFETVEGILDNLQEFGCDGFSLQPLSLYDWPKSSDTCFRYQWQRDAVWYTVWGGSPIDDMIRRGSPKWLLRNHRLVPGFGAASRILELLALYFAGASSDSWRPQFCSMRGAHLFSIRDMLQARTSNYASETSDQEWWTQVTGEKVVHLGEYIKTGTPAGAYGPEELIEELTDLSEQGTGAGDKGMRNASGEKELPGLARDAFCMGRLGEFYVERVKAALAYARNNYSEALEHMGRAIGVFREIKSVDSSHRTPFRLAAGRATIIGSWLDTIRALEAEYADAQSGEFKSGDNYPVHNTESIL